MKFSRHPGIRLKITAAFALVFTLLSVVLNIYSYHKIRRLIIADNNRYLLSQAKSLLDKTEVNPVIIPLPQKNTFLKIFARNYNGSKTLLFQSPGAIQKISLPKRTGVSDTLGFRVAYVSNTSDDNPAELMLAVNAASLQATLRYLLLLLLLSTLISVLISGVISFWLARFFLKPLQQIIHKTNSITAGHLKERVPVKQSNDELQELAETINDMLQRIDQALQQQQNFFASASHELKTPLAVMRAELEVNLRRNETSEQMTNLLNSQMDEINRLQKIVEEFLVISQIKAGRLSLNPDKFDLSDLCLKTGHQLRALATAKNLKTVIRFDEETEDFTIFADKEKMRIVISNLLVNAIKYSTNGSVINCTVGYNAEKQQMVLEVENSIPEESLDTANLTTAFYRKSVLDIGAGVGLWLCREIIEAHGGQLNLHSSNYHFVTSVLLPVKFAV
ncbi:HAMP domain-containing sensor histidine kinase [Mucilaginibacter sp. KACC 22063]|uniref:HAMP domain-containing sensor histidine kinase n=1 Tax=Mucilaginibacter sp. KACC 22063 TaxID=3025666 RepID=UPI0023654B20|nr:HAMP domain-containing sensor histidine kinase [Mucilaginibacter sp. KACC 22063]WDF56127.1 HAMP domain-containing sensor histidine kinase [Mucilaginibacter sp. KACC 22063]